MQHIFILSLCKRHVGEKIVRFRQGHTCDFAVQVFKGKLELSCGCTKTTLLVYVVPLCKPHKMFAFGTTAHVF